VCPPVWVGHFAAGLGDNPNGSIAIHRGVLYVGNGNGTQVDAFAASGCRATACWPLWAYDAPGVNTPAGLAVVGNHLYAAAATGVEAFPRRCAIHAVCLPVWRDPNGAGAHLVLANGVIYAAGGEVLFADDAATGHRLWTYTTSANSNTPPTVANGEVYFAVLGARQLLAFTVRTR